MKRNLRWILAVIIFLSAMVYFTSLTNSKQVQNVNNLNHEESASLLSPERIVNIAHRGASGHAPEHTIRSYEYAKKMGTDYLEIDLHMTADGELVAIHDQKLQRTTGYDGLVSDMSLRDLKRLDAGSWFNQENPKLANPDFEKMKIPSLAEILDQFGTEVNYYIEIKAPSVYPGMIDELLETLSFHHLLEENRREGSVIIQSFSAASLKKVHQLDASIPLIQLLHQKQQKLSEVDFEEIAQYAIGVGAPYQALNPDLIHKIKGTDLLVHAYTVNQSEEMEQLLDWGGVTGIFTDYPDVLADILEDR
ncbi:glycerophosphoryl diester phosphodiesterase [Gracilibacillus boraciitolerans JCM 21714]|uniref:Glycerophosphoryl diester phosphodiesterase n=2 Tax=Gracilibacillus boraciitolerans TaxID=307521 RepID=W4VID6_9BACI|nr:glycerophosphodiester phosphodiesterase [Gracilibacillus boraciitolerans]GAE93175.1 glycerophosphoryl diester phosphodiesterase [Gracilibacillus boraciitolerans JCM 21714]